MRPSYKPKNVFVDKLSKSGRSPDRQHNQRAASPPDVSPTFLLLQESSPPEPESPEYDEPWWLLDDPPDDGGDYEPSPDAEAIFRRHNPSPIAGQNHRQLSPATCSSYVTSPETSPGIPNFTVNDMQNSTKVKAQRVQHFSSAPRDQPRHREKGGEEHFDLESLSYENLLEFMMTTQSEHTHRDLLQNEHEIELADWNDYIEYLLLSPLLGVRQTSCQTQEPAPASTDKISRPFSQIIFEQTHPPSSSATPRSLSRKRKSIMDQHNILMPSQLFPLDDQNNISSRFHPYSASTMKQPTHTPPPRINGGSSRPADSQRNCPEPDRRTPS